MAEEGKYLTRQLSPKSKLDILNAERETLGKISPRRAIKIRSPHDNSIITTNVAIAQSLKNKGWKVYQPGPEGPRIQYITDAENQKDSIAGGKADNKSIYDIAQVHINNYPQYTLKQLIGTIRRQIIKGIEVELEHTNNRKIAEEIAKDHIIEDLFYYHKLATIHKENKQMNIKKLVENIITEGYASESKLVAAIRFLKHNISNAPGEMKSSIQKLIDLKIPSNIIFQFSALFPRNSFKIDFIRTGRLDYEIKRLYFTGAEKEMLEKAQTVKEFLLAGDNYHQDKNWYRNY